MSTPAVTLLDLRNSLKALAGGWEQGYQKIRVGLSSLKAESNAAGHAALEEFLTEFENCLGMADDMLREKLSTAKQPAEEKLSEIEAVLGLCVDALETVTLAAANAAIIADDLREKITAPFYQLVECCTTDSVTFRSPVVATQQAPLDPVSSGTETPVAESTPTPATEKARPAQSTEQFSTPAPAGNPLRLKTCLLVKFGSNHFAIPILQVIEILNFRYVSPLPVPHERIIGVLNLRGRTLPVFDFERCVNAGAGKILSQAKAVELDEEERPCIVVVTDGTRTFGLSVDGVSRVVDIPEAGFEVFGRVIPEHSSQGSRNPVTHLVRFEDLTILLADILAF